MANLSTRDSFAKLPAALSATRRRLTVLLLGAVSCGCLGLLASPAIAMDRFEIQVYEADVNRPGQFGLEVHTNYTMKGQTQPAYEGEVPADRVGRLTLEPAFGVTEWMEVGGYLQTMLAPDSGFQYAGLKARTKFVLPARYTEPFFFGINIELGRVPRQVEEDGWANEFRPIIGFDNGILLLAINPIFGYALTGRDKFKLDLEPAGKVSVNTQTGFAVGAEYYSGLGLPGDGLPPLAKQEHLLFATVDLKEPKSTDSHDDPWELNIAIGRGLTDGTATQWILKTIVGRAF